MKSIRFAIGLAGFAATATIGGLALAQTPAPAPPAAPATPLPPQVRSMAALNAWIGSAIQLSAHDGTWFLLDSNNTGVRLTTHDVDADEDNRTVQLRLERFEPMTGEKEPVLSEYFEVIFDCHRHIRSEKVHDEFAQQNLKGPRHAVNHLDRGVANGDTGSWHDLEKAVCKDD